MILYWTKCRPEGGSTLQKPQYWLVEGSAGGTPTNGINKRVHTFTATSTQTPRTEAKGTNYFLMEYKNEHYLRPRDLAITPLILLLILSGLNFK